MRLGFALICLLGVAQAHPIAATIGEGHWRPDRGVIEVSLRMPTHDVQTEVGNLVPETSAIEAMVRKAFVVDGAQLNWIGTELKVETTWVYFEVPAKAGQTLTLRNRLFFGQSTRQVNTLNLVLGKTRETLQWSAGEPIQQLTLPKGK